MRDLNKAVGVCHHPDHDELRTLYAIYHLEKENPTGFDAWPESLLWSWMGLMT